LKSD
jgi:hypothetical protein